MPAKATMKVTAVEVTCPHCDASVSDPDQGSFYWEISQIARFTGREVECDGCGKAVLISLPKRVAVA